MDWKPNPPLQPICQTNPKTNELHGREYILYFDYNGLRSSVPHFPYHSEYHILIFLTPKQSSYYPSLFLCNLIGKIITLVKRLIVVFSWYTKSGIEDPSPTITVFQVDESLISTACFRPFILF